MLIIAYKKSLLPHCEVQEHVFEDSNEKWLANRMNKKIKLVVKNINLLCKLKSYVR